MFIVIIICCLLSQLCVSLIITILNFFVFFLYSCICGFFRSNCFHCYAMNVICVVCGFWDTRTYKKKGGIHYYYCEAAQAGWLAKISENKLRSWIFHRNVFLPEYFIHTMVYRFMCSHTCVWYQQQQISERNRQEWYIL